MGQPNYNRVIQIHGKLPREAGKASYSQIEAANKVLVKKNRDLEKENKKLKKELEVLKGGGSEVLEGEKLIKKVKESNKRPKTPKKVVFEDEELK